MGAPDLVKLKATADAANRAVASAEADAAAIAKAKATPRPPGVVLGDLLALVVMRLGNRKDLQLLLAEFKAGVEPEPAAEPT